MILKRLRKVAADSNVLLSAVIGKAALKVFTHTDLEVFTTSFNVEEVREYLPHLANKYDLDVKQVWLQLSMLPLTIVPENQYKNKLRLAKKYLSARDKDDIHLAALALAKGMAIWSNDDDFNEVPGMLVYPTAKLLSLFYI